MKALSLDDFGRFLQAVHGHPPFPWQARLLATVHQTGWPATLDLPTASGKTTALDVAVFHQAMEAHLPAAKRRAPRRVAYVVDRRVVVDQAHIHARRLAAALSAPDDPVVASVAERLRALTGPVPLDGAGGAQEAPVPLATAILRGAMIRDESWAQSADQPTIVVSTVDQVGSRLLFRGYGVSEGMRPVHAGLLGQDTLFLLDEVHLSQPFAQTLAWLGGGEVGLPDWKGYLRWREAPLPDRWAVVALSATPRMQREVFTLGTEDRSHPVLGARLKARKLATLKKVRGSQDAADALEHFGQEAAELAYALLGKTGAKTLGLLLNRVDSARAAAERLQREHGGELDVVLVTGRMRPLDRDDVFGAIDAHGRTLLARLQDRETRREDDRPLILVSTQAIEAGADFDLDGLVTECASLDALRQRFGRVDRRGLLGESRSLILRRSGATGQDPVYGEALDATWRLLENLGGDIDFGADALAGALGDRDLEDYLPQTIETALLRPADLDAWSRTRPAPSAEPDPALFLHGVVETRPEVQVVWRTEVAALEGAGEDAPAPDAGGMVTALAACPPSSLEALSLPIGAVRAWLSRSAAPELADVEGGLDPDGDTLRRGRSGRLALRWRGDDSEVVGARDLRPGDTLIVPPAYGGLRLRNWDPIASGRDPDPVVDWGDRAQSRHRGRPTLRLSDAARQAWSAHHPAPPSRTDDPSVDREALTVWLTGVADAPDLPDWVREAARYLSVPRNRKLIHVGGQGDGAVVQAARPQTGFGLETVADVVSDEATTPFTSSAVPLDRHLEAVGAEAGRLARSLGLPDDLAADVELAGRLHDLGKADPRFQRMLYGGSEAAFRIEGVVLAKSGLPAGDRQAREDARAAAGWPRGLRHELTSVALAESSSLLDAARDRDLVLHLIASHHGHARPLAPPVADTAPVEVGWTFAGQPLAASSDHGLWRLDADLPARYERLVARYGWHGLAWLETLVRLADQRVSAAQAGEAV